MAPTGSRKTINPSPPSSNGGSPASGRDRSTSTSRKQGSGANWYPGTWPAVSRASKAAPVTEVARESISVAKNVASNVTSSSTSLLDSSRQHRNPSLQLTRKQGASTRSLPANATTTCINIASDGSLSTPVADTPLESPGPTTQQKDKEEPHDKGIGFVDEGVKKDPNNTAETATSDVGVHTAKPDNTPALANQTGGWLSWLYGSYATENSTPNDSTPVKPPTDPCDEDQTPKADDTETDNKGPEEQDKAAEDTNTTGNTETTEITEVPAPPQSRSWLQMWYGSSSSSKGPEHPPKEIPKKEEPTDPPTADDTAIPSADTVPKSNEETERPAEAGDLPKAPAESAKSSTWSFWFRDTKGSSGGKHKMQSLLKLQWLMIRYQNRQPVI
ncbi:hypothetical protein AWENTII_007965 [Aspergillus wentii]